MTLVNKVLLIYTGGTIGMNRNPRTGALEPFKFEHLLANVPELNDFDVEINTYQFTPPIDSSDMSPQLWIDLVHIIANNYEQYDGFVILHGTDYNWVKELQDISKAYKYFDTYVKSGTPAEWWKDNKDDSLIYNAQ